MSRKAEATTVEAAGCRTSRSSRPQARMRSPRPLSVGVMRAARPDTGWRMKVGELIRLREEDGWRLARTRGSHRQYKNANKPGTVTVAGNRAWTCCPTR